MEDKQKRLTIKEIFDLGDKRTQGKWVYDGYRNAIYTPNIDNFNIAKFPQRNTNSPISHEEYEANKNYITAAPDIEYYLRQLVELLPDIYENIETHVAIVNGFGSALSISEAEEVQNKLNTLMKEMGID